jgi:hypothetical protein
MNPVWDTISQQGQFGVLTISFFSYHPLVIELSEQRSGVEGDYGPNGPSYVLKF